MFIQGLRRAPVAAILSEELAHPLEELEATFRSYGETARGSYGVTCTTAQESEKFGAAPGKFTDWEAIPEGSDLLFYEGLHGAIVTGKADVSDARI